ncbi:MAG TPA: nuclear transport factor 2 family protein [Gemmatimonadota bacterium]|nr:nuclear transport factor 2 family protein [Gemmatimonadota bacterium]
MIDGLEILRAMPRFALAAALALGLLRGAELEAQTPAERADELLAADRAFAASAEAGLVDALAGMFAADVIVPAPGGTFLRGKEAAVEALEANPANVGTRATWTPVRVGLSADGLHGFTFGYMTATGSDSTATQFKYMTYWERQPDGWRARGWKRAPREAFDVPATVMDPALPAALVDPSTDPDAIRVHEESLAAAENGFSRDAQAIGLEAAFVQYGSADAVNMGPRSGPYVVGADAIGRMVGEGEPVEGSSVSWGPDEEVIVASSGDLGITFGHIRSNDPASDSPPFSFFTIWRRTSPDAPWRYIAE